MDPHPAALRFDVAVVGGQAKCGSCSLHIGCMSGFLAGVGLERDGGTGPLFRCCRGVAPCPSHLPWAGEQMTGWGQSVKRGGKEAPMAFGAFEYPVPPTWGPVSPKSFLADHGPLRQTRIGAGWGPWPTPRLACETGSVDTDVDPRPAPCFARVVVCSSSPLAAGCCMYSVRRTPCPINTPDSLHG